MICQMLTSSFLSGVQPKCRHHSQAGSKGDDVWWPGRPGRPAMTSFLMIRMKTANLGQQQIRLFGVSLVLTIVS